MRDLHSRSIGPDMVARDRFITMNPNSLAMRSHEAYHRLLPEQINNLRVRMLPEIGVGIMPAWMELLLNVIGYGGFIAIATYHRRSSEKLPGPGQE